LRRNIAGVSGGRTGVQFSAGDIAGIDTRNTFQGAAFANCEMAVAVATMLRTVELSMPQRERRRKPPRSVPRGIAIVPRREVGLVATNRAAVT
jgi:hypothetical protein